MANFWYNTAKLREWAGAAGQVDLIANTIKVMALENDAGEDIDDEFIADIIAAGAVEVTSIGYVGGFGGAGRKVIAGNALAVDLVNNWAWFDLNDVVWAAITQAAAEQWVALVLIKEVTNDNDSPVLAHIDTGAGFPLTPNGGNITLTIDATGLLHIT